MVFSGAAIALVAKPGPSRMMVLYVARIECVITLRKSFTLFAV